MSYYKEIKSNIGSSKEVNRDSDSFQLIAVILLIILLFSNIHFSTNENNLVPNSLNSFEIAELPNLPNASIKINILGTLFGNQIEAELDFSIEYDNITTMYLIGFYQQFLVIKDSLLFTHATGLGYDEMREYPFAYTEDGMITDYWVNHTPNWISRRDYAAWTPVTRSSGYLGPITEENMTHLTKAGDIIEFENLTIYFDDGSSFLCGPRLITVGVNFTQQNDNWQCEYLLYSSDSQNTQIQDSELTIHLQEMDPISIPFLGFSFVIIVAVVLSLICHRYRIRKRMSKMHTIELKP